MEIVFVTGNASKVRHAEEALKNTEVKIIQKKVDLIEPREEDPEKVVAEKALQAAELLACPVIVEDSGIFIEALNGFPKTFVHFAQDTIGIEGVIKLMEGNTNRKAEFRQSLAYFEPGMDNPKIFSYVDGGFRVADKIFDSEESDASFDKILIPPGESEPLSTFTRDWRAKRDSEANKETIHYQQLAKWLLDRKK